MKKAVLIFLFISIVSVVHAQVVCTNISPVAIAGNDTTIQSAQTSCAPIPITITLNGSSSFDPDGTITSYLWSGLNGITNPGSAITTVTDLAPGTYWFILKVTDNSGAFTYDTIQISIVSANRPLVQAQLIPIGTLSQVRGGITIAASNNKILFAGGGVPPGYCATSRVDIYDINTNSWATAELSEARNGMGLAVLGNRIFFGGGFSPKIFPNTTPPWCYIGNSFYPDTRSSAVDIYDASSNTWSTAQLSTRRAPAGAAAGNKVIFAGGDLSVVAIPSNVVNIYDTSSNSWTNTTIAEVKSLPQIAIAGNKMYLAGGGASLDADNNCLCFSRRIDIYDALSDLWSVDSLSMERAEMGSISANNKIYWAGGYILSTDPNSYYQETTSSVEIRDLVTNTTSFDCMSKPRAPVTALKKNNKLLFFDNSATFDIYDLITNSWSIGVLPLAIHWYSVFSHNDNVYIAGAYLDNDYVPSNQVWKLEINNCTNSTSSAITASACDAYTFNGKTYRASGLYRQILLNAAGCDSVVTLNLTINYPTNCTMSVTACNNYTWQGQTYTASGFYSDTLVSSGGCDSILNLDLAINYILATVTATICEGQNYEGYTATGIYIDTLVAAGGCDSIRTLNLTVNPRAVTSVNASVCEGQNYEGHTATGIYIDTLAAANGCDSIRTLNLTVNPGIITSVSASVCEGQNYGGHFATGIYIDTLATVNGCDSIRTLNLTVKPKSFSTTNTTICEGDSYAGYTSGGTYTDILVASNGCDSIRTINLTVKPKSHSVINQTICQGQSYSGYSSNGIFTDTLNAVNGCDSIRTIHLTVFPIIQPYLGDDRILCTGDSLKLYPGAFNSYNWQNGSTQSEITVRQSGLYSVTVTDNCHTARDEIMITESACDIYFPSAFTPNNDGKNDWFRILGGFNIKEYHLVVYNRWGQKVFETFDPARGWNGIFNGQLEPTAAFVWYCEFNKPGNADKTKMKGAVTLIR